MYLTNGPAGGNGNGYGGGNYNGGMGNLTPQGGQGGAGGALPGTSNSGCYNCGKLRHYARDCWTSRGHFNQQNQNTIDPELEEIKEHHRQLRRERQELEEKRKAEEEKKAREEDELRQNQDFARKMEELKLQLLMDLNEEWKKKNQEAELALKNATVKTRRLFAEKKTKLSLRMKIDKAIRCKAGVGVRKRINVKLRFDSCIKKSSIRKMAEDVIEARVTDRAVAKFLRTRIRIIWTRNRTVGEVLHNQKRFASDNVQVCRCRDLNLPRCDGHVVTRLSELPHAPSFVKNSKNITRPAARRAEPHALMRAVQEATRFLGGTTPVLTVPEDAYDGRRHQSTAWTTDEVKTWASQFEDLVMTPIDRNQGDTTLICPVIYRHAFGKVFLWNTNYEAVGTGEDEPANMAKSKKDFIDIGLRKLGPWRPGGRMGTAYVIPKHKDLGRWRPIAPSPSDPAAVAQRRVARALHYLLIRLSA
ncbi:hypothetical protein CBR_g31261 [Chara braunii]|uniref:CCHC-type domain-containing protein n=1 Tax=Chara braunii TaxID=69332 RepID=A0A388JXW7_CHABU|nr:hypothetical protein CBR_g31261 [Chara braunii]|eukprot:GBG62625.1 hypothetical protein CBR_g31261 [Chara braunii]